MYNHYCRDVLGEIFWLCDLDGDGLLNREEFSLFNLRTSGEAVVLDDEWEVVEGECLVWRWWWMTSGRWG